MPKPQKLFFYCALSLSMSASEKGNSSVTAYKCKTNVQLVILQQCLIHRQTQKTKQATLINEHLVHLFLALNFNIIFRLVFWHGVVTTSESSNGLLTVLNIEPQFSDDTSVDQVSTILAVIIFVGLSIISIIWIGRVKGW